VFCAEQAIVIQITMKARPWLFIFYFYLFVKAPLLFYAIAIILLESNPYTGCQDGIAPRLAMNYGDIMRITVLLSVLVLLLGTFALSIQDADAARIGGGRSFGSRPTMSQPAPSSSVNRPSATQNQPGAAATAAAPNRGLFGGMGGMLGGLLAGSLLGSMLFGGGFSGGGFMDILLLGLVAFFAFKFFSRRRAASSPNAAAAGAHGAGAAAPQQPTMFSQASEAASAGWSRLQNQPAQQVASEAGVSVPAGFDVDDFLRGAKVVYNRLQDSWDKRNLSDIGQFSSPAVMEELRRQFAEDPTPSTTQILMLKANLLGVEEGAGEQRAQVLFEASLRESKVGMAEEVREVWHFVRQMEGDTMWRLDGIQQVN
jgi:predicted lipid-binding transport protein (Tim44 family)